MTKVMLNISDNEIFFDCENHAGNKLVCGNISTLCNVLVRATESENLCIDKYETGHVRIYIPKPNNTLKSVFSSVKKVFEALEDDNKDMLKMY